jgi:glycosyltransferase involved in cell wall biosynthesis
VPVSLTSSSPVAGATERRPLRLLHVLGYAGVGGQVCGITGVERVVQILVEGLDPERFAQQLVYPRAGQLFDLFQSQGRVVVDREPRGRFDPGYLRALAGALGAHGADVVVSHGLRLDFHAAIACRRLGLPHVVRRPVALADEVMPAHRRFLYGLVDAWTLGQCSGIVAVSHVTKRRMVETQRVPAAKIAVIPNGARVPAVSAADAQAARAALGVEPGDRIVGGVGQLIPRKAFHVLVEALARLGTRHSGLVGVVLGEGPERAHLQRLAESHGVRLLLPGYLANPYPTLAGFDVAVLPSRAEGMPLVVVEAMALGVACVATPAAGTAELVEDGVSGLLVPPGDTVRLAAALDELLADAALRQRLAAAGRTRIQEHYSIDAMLGGFTAYLEKAARRSTA